GANPSNGAQVGPDEVAHLSDAMARAARTLADLESFSAFGHAALGCDQRGQSLQLAAASVVFGGKFVQRGCNNGEALGRQVAKKTANLALLKCAECGGFRQLGCESLADFSIGRRTNGSHRFPKFQRPE